MSGSNGCNHCNSTNSKLFCRFKKFDISLPLETIIDTVLTKSIDTVLLYRTSEFTGEEYPVRVLTHFDLLKMIAYKTTQDTLDTNIHHIIYHRYEVFDINKVTNITLPDHCEYIVISENNQILHVLNREHFEATLNNPLPLAECLYPYVLENIFDSVCIIDTECKVRYWNKASEKLYGISREVLLGKDITDFFPNALIPKVLTEDCVYENVFNKPKDNSYVVINARPLKFNGKIIGALSCDKDMTDYVKLSEKLTDTHSSLSHFRSELEKTDVSQNFEN